MVSFSRKAITRMQSMILVAVVVIASIAVVGVYYATLPPAKSEIKIGAALSQTGSMGALGFLILNGYKLWLEQVNERGGLLGIPVNIVAYDDKSDPVTTKSLYERLVTVDEVDLLLGPFSSACTFPMHPVAEKYEMVNFNPINNAVKLYIQGWTYIFYMAPGNVPMWQQWALMAEYFNHYWPGEIKTVAFMNIADLYSRDGANNAAGWFEENGYDVLVVEEIPKGATDVSTPISKIKELDPDLFGIYGFLGEETLAIRTAKELGWQPKIWCSGGGGANVAAYADTLGVDSNGVTFTCSFNPESINPLTQKFVKDYTAKCGDAPDNKGVSGYNAAYLLEEIVTAVGMEGIEDQSLLRDYMIKTPMECVLGPWKIIEPPDNVLFYYQAGEKKTDTFANIPYYSAVMVQWQHEKWAIVYPEDVATADPWFPMPEFGTTPS
jgi:branched-chain amino acid transport system substrate-binding protein